MHHCTGACAMRDMKAMTAHKLNVPLAVRGLKKQQQTTLLIPRLFHVRMRYELMIIFCIKSHLNGSNHTVIHRRVSAAAAHAVVYQALKGPLAIEVSK